MRELMHPNRGRVTALCLQSPHRSVTSPHTVPLTHPTTRLSKRLLWHFRFTCPTGRTLRCSAAHVPVCMHQQAYSE